MPEQTRSGEPRERPGSAEADELREEIARQKEEILRLRDLLIAKDAELGAARGRVAELSEHSARFSARARSLQARARVPGLLRGIAARLRRS